MRAFIEDINPEDLIRFIDFHMRQRNIRSFNELAAIADIDSGSMSRLMTGKTLEPTPSTLVKLASALGVPRERMFEAAGYFKPQGPLKPEAKALARLINRLPQDDIELIESLVKRLLET